MAESILVIDDDLAVRKAFQFALEDTPYEIDTVESGEKGIEQLAKKNYALVFLDLKMPGMTGTETLRQLRNLDHAMPVYVVTAFHKEFLLDLQTLRQEGVRFELLRKPLGIDEIQMLVNGVLSKPSSY